ncbi:universal stress protein [Phytoactinopolyspora alkaliphila]|uniref:Universal stress protein n=1 Tax=Phytoactinopolyspora alkaliphila TaxID=1783498 RepID=A0A6N9YUP5_9ACTN|nr:universal stress protein [Phytoactinopolyspora alkaliphila]NED98519.1 universal stress protein [Phytoactinopolyspora alkaliphila]
MDIEARVRETTRSRRSLVNQPIGVGVSSSASAMLAAEWAAREAVRRGCGVRLVHAYPAEALYDPLASSAGHARGEVAFDAARRHVCAPSAGHPQGWPVGDGAEYLRADGRKVVEEAVAAWRARYPGVPVEYVVDDRSAPTRSRTTASRPTV